MDANRQPIGVKRGDFSMNLIQELNIFLLKGLHFILKSGGISWFFICLIKNNIWNTKKGIGEERKKVYPHICIAS